LHFLTKGVIPDKGWGVTWNRLRLTLQFGWKLEKNWVCPETKVNQRTPWRRGWAFILGPPTTTTRRHCASVAGRSLWKFLFRTDFNTKWG